LGLESSGEDFEDLKAKFGGMYLI